MNYECECCGEATPQSFLYADVWLNHVICGACKREFEDEDHAWQREQAFEAGMAFGCDGYNDMMGY